MAIGKMSLSNAVVKSIGLDFGTVNTSIYLEDKGLVLEEPTVIAIDTKTNEIVAVGAEASNLIERNPNNINVIKPIKNGVVADFDAAAALLKVFLKKVIKNNFNRNKFVVLYPSNATEVEKIAVEDVVRHCGGSDIIIMDTLISTLIASGISPVAGKAQMLIDFGATHTEVIVCNFGEIIASYSKSVGGIDIDENIIKYVKAKYLLQISKEEAEQLKINLGSTFPVSESFHKFYEVKGRNVLDRMPKIISISSDEIREVIKQVTNEALNLIVRVCEELPPQISADLLEQEIIISGGSSKLLGMKEFIEDFTGIKVKLLDNPTNIMSKKLLTVDKIERKET